MVPGHNGAGACWSDGCPNLWRLVGIVSLGDLAAIGEAAWAGEALGGISQPGGDHFADGALIHHNRI
jgi:hypothetical protein